VVSRKEQIAPAAFMTLRTPEDVRECCRRLIDEVGRCIQYPVSNIREVGADAQTLDPTEAIRLCREYIKEMT
jgi:hypothetical protein